MQTAEYETAPSFREDVRRLYWGTQTPVAQIAKRFGLPAKELATFAGPADIGVRCSGGGAPVLATSRHRRDEMRYVQQPWFAADGWEKRADYLLMCSDCYKVESRRLWDLNHSVERGVIAEIMAWIVLPFLCDDENPSAWANDANNIDLVWQVTHHILAALAEQDVKLFLAHRLQCEETRDLVAQAFAEEGAPDHLPSA